MCDLVLLATCVISQWCHGPGTANCVHYRQNFILWDFSSSHRRVVSNVGPGTTSYIHYFSVMSLGIDNHNPHPPTPQHLPSSKHHSSSWWIRTACMKDAKGNPWYMAMGIVICMAIAESVHIHSVPTMSKQTACVYNMAIKKTMHKQWMHQKSREEWGLHQSWCKTLLHYAWVWKAIVSGREVQISLQMVVNNIFNQLVGRGHYSSSKCNNWYAPWGNFYNLSSCHWWTKISFHQSSRHNHGHNQINSRSYSTICGDE